MAAFTDVVRRRATAMVVTMSDSTPHTMRPAAAPPFAVISPANAGEVGSDAPRSASQPGTVEISPVAIASTPTRALIQRPMPPKTATSAWLTAAKTIPVSYTHLTLPTTPYV